MSGTKTCLICKVEKPVTSFYWNKEYRRKRDGGAMLNPGYWGSYCKPCNIEKKNAWQRANPDKVKNHIRKTLYGLRPEEFSRRLEDQGGVCPCCGDPKPNHVDHDHRSGKFRGVLCGRCNVALGMVRDNVEVLDALAAYLVRTR